MKAIRTILALAAATAVLGAAGCTGEERSSSVSDIERSFATLVELFKAPDPDMTAYAASTESFSKSPEAMSYIVKKAQSKDEDERAVCADVLGAIQDKKAVWTLASMVEDDSSKTRDRVYVALQNHNTDEARAALAHAMRVHGPESGLVKVVCEVNDEELWTATCETIIERIEAGAEIALDPQAISLLIAAAKEHESEAAGFDSEEFELRMAEFAKKMEERFGGDDWDHEDWAAREKS